MNQLFLGSALRKTVGTPARRIFRVENHDEALPIWRDSGCENRVLVHVDAHHDMWWVAPGQPVTIANFISPALRDGLLREIFWVVPDRSWESAENRRQIFHHVKRMQREFPGGQAPVETTHNRISTTLVGKPLHICSVEQLPKFQEEVLLDLDVDYMILSRVTYGPGDPHLALPWVWPAELLSRLDSREVRSDLVTIAYSVIGGFTPLQWKYLGDELEARLIGSDEDALLGARWMRDGADAAHRGDFSAAEQNYSHAAQCLPKLAAPLWRLASLLLDRGRAEEARGMYQRALRVDPSYSGPYNSDGLWHYWDSRWKAAEVEFRRTLALDPEDAFAHIGLGWLAMERKQWQAAESELRLALVTQPDLLDAHRSLGKVLLKMGRKREAAAAYENSLKLALLGQDSLRETPGIAAERSRFNDQRHFAAYLRLGRLYFALGENHRADAYLRMAAAGGLDGVALRCRLVGLAIRRKKWKMAAAELVQVSKQLGVQTGRAISKFWRGVRRPFRRAYELWQVR